MREEVSNSIVELGSFPELGFAAKTKTATTLLSHTFDKAQGGSRVAT